MSAQAATPADNFPPGYEPPKVWEPEANPGGPFGAMNKPTAGPRSEKELPVGKHDLQLYSLGTPNGQKVTLLLEELYDGLGVEYDAWTINIGKLDQFTSGFTAINPNSKIPALVDRSLSPPLRVFESGSILVYLADKYKRFIPPVTDVRRRAECMSWLFWQMGSAPLLGGGFGHFYKYAPIKIKYAVDRYAMEAKRLLDVLERHLAGADTDDAGLPVRGKRTYIMGDEYTIADMAIAPWIKCIDTGYHASEFLNLDSYKNVVEWVARVYDRPASKRGARVNGMGDDKVVERHSRADFDAAPAAPAAAAEKKEDAPAK